VYKRQRLNTLIDSVVEEAAAAKVKPKTAKKVKLGKNQVALSTITGGRLPASGIDHILTYYDDDEFAVEDRVNIPKLNKKYRWNPEVLEAMIIAHRIRERALLQGYPGTGKSTACEQFAHWLRQPFLCINGKEDMESSTFLGCDRVVMEDGEKVMAYELGMIPRGLVGRYFICIDEVWKIPPGIQMVLQSLYQKDGFIILDDIPGKPEDRKFSSEGAVIFLTDNVLGTGDDITKSAASQFQDTSTLDRIGITIPVPYLNKAEEIQMLSDWSKVELLTITKLVSMANLIRHGYKHDKVALTLSVRGLECMLNQISEASTTMEYAFKLAYTNKIASDEEKAFIVNAWRTA